MKILECGALLACVLCAGSAAEVQSTAVAMRDGVRLRVRRCLTARDFGGGHIPCGSASSGVSSLTQGHSAVHEPNEARQEFDLPGRL